MFSAAKKSALLVDFDNLYIERWEQRLVDGLPNWLAWLEDGGFDPLGVRRRFVTKRVYWNIHFDSDHRIPFQRRGFENIVCRAVRNKDRASSADFVITVDAVELRHEARGLDEVIILTFDSDFLTVLGHLQSKDLAVVGMAAGHDRPAQAYRQLADFVIEAPAFEAAFKYERPKRGLFGPVRATPVAATVAPTPATPPAAPSRAPRPSAPRAAPPAAPRASRQRAPQFDFKRAARLVEDAAAKSPTPYLAKKLVEQALQPLENFRTTGSFPWLGRRDYPSMIDAIAAESDVLEVRIGRNNGKVLFFRGAEEQPSAARR